MVCSTAVYGLVYKRRTNFLLNRVLFIVNICYAGFAAQTKTIKAFTGKLKLKLVHYRRGKILTKLLKQKQNFPISLYKQLLVINLTLNGFFDFLNLQLNDYQKFESLIFNN